MKYITEDGVILDENCEDCVMFYKTPNNHDVMAVNAKTATYFDEPSKTDQSFVEDADINTVMTRLKAGQQVDIPLPEHFGVDNRIDLYEARMRIAESNATFYNLDPSIRADFLNDPARWEQAVAKALDDGDRGKLRSMGLDVPDPPAAPPAGSPVPGPQGATGGVSAPPEPPKTTDPPK